MNSGSPLAARMGLNIFVVLIIALVIAVVFLVLFILSKKIEEYKESSTYIVKNKNKPTSPRQVQDASKRAGLTKSEKNILSEVFKAHPLPNIQFVLKEQTIMESYFKELFEGVICKRSEVEKSNFFSTRQKIFQTFDAGVLVKNSRLIPLETPFTYTPSKGIHYNLQLINSDSEEMHILIPATLTNDEKPEILSKINLVFVYKNSNPYNLETRVVRYQKGKNNTDLLVCSHTDKITPLQKRMAPRMDLNIVCDFSSVKVEKSINHKKEITNYIPSDKMHGGILADVSAGGCRIFTRLPIKAEQHIFIKGHLDGKNDASAIGIILRTTKNKKDEYILHIKFLEITESTINSINTAACGYKTA